MDKFIVYTDGSSKGNPGPGGYGAIIFDEKNVKEIGGWMEKTTNNRMEITAAIKALQNLPIDTTVEICTDSEYLMKGITVWIKNWQKNDWRTKNKKQVLNKELWLELLAETDKRKIEWKKVLGHSNHKLNDRCDQIATGFADGKNVLLYNGPVTNYQFHSVRN